MTQQPHQQFGKNVCRLRGVQNLTQEKLSEKSEISRRYLQQIEAGAMNPTVNVVYRIKKALKVTWDELFEKLD